MILKGKKAAVFGVANGRSLGWHIAESLSRAGAAVCLGYQNERLERWVKPLAEKLSEGFCFPCDVNKPEEIEKAFQLLEDRFGELHVLVHSIAFAETKDLSGPFLDTSREGFRTALETSAYSLVSLCRAALPLFERAGEGSVITLTASGARAVIPQYNVMGVAKAALEASVRYLAYELGTKNIRVNAISSGPVSTLSSRAIRGFSEMKRIVAERCPLKRNVEGSEVGAAAVFLASDSSLAVTGEILHVDAGDHILA